MLKVRKFNVRIEDSSTRLICSFICVRQGLKSKLLLKSELTLKIDMYYKIFFIRRLGWSFD